MSGIVGRHEGVTGILVGDRVSGIDDVFASGAQHFQDSLFGAGFDGGRERVDRLIRIGKGLLGMCAGRRH